MILISPSVEMVFEPIPTNLKTLFLFTQIIDFIDDSLIKFTLDPVSTRKMACSGENAKFSNFTNGAGPKFFYSSVSRELTFPRVLTFPPNISEFFTTKTLYFPFNSLYVFALHIAILEVSHTSTRHNFIFTSSLIISFIFEFRGLTFVVHLFPTF